MALITKAFEKFDRTGDGIITIDDMKKFYNVSEHKDFKNGKKTEEEIIKECLAVFEGGSADGMVCGYLENTISSFLIIKK